MKLYSKNTGKFALFCGVGLMLTVLCSFFIFGGLGSLSKRAFADGTEQTTTTTTSLPEDFAVTTLNLESGSYQIKTVDDLRTLAYYINKGTDSEYSTYANASYKMTQDLDLSEFSFWEAIGTGNRPFMGVFDGGGYSIYGLTIIEDTTKVNTADTYRGLFGYVKYNGTTKAEIKNLGLKDTLIKSNGTYTGGLVGLAEGLTTTDIGMVSVSKCYNTGYVEGGDNVGGLIGAMKECATISDCYFAGTVADFGRFTAQNVNATYDVVTNVDGGFVGGLTGSAVDDSVHRIIEHCYNAGRVGAVGVELSEITRGALVGDTTSIKPALLKYNFFLSSALSGASRSVLRAQGGSYSSLDNITGDTWTGLYFSIDVADTNVYLPTDSTGVGFTKTWQWSQKVNYGLPFLRETQQLISVEFDMSVGEQALGSDEIVNSLKTGQGTTDNTGVRLVSGDKYFVSIIEGAYLTVSSIPTEKSDADYSYKFNNWSQNALKLAFVGDKTWTSRMEASTNATAVSCADVDKVFIANYVEREYSLSLYPNDVDLIQQDGLVAKIGDTVLDSSSKIKYGDEITLSATPTAGYKLSKFATATTKATIDEVDILEEQENGVWTLYTKYYIQAIGYAVTTSTSASIAETVMKTPMQIVANLVPESYKFYYQTNRASCYTAGYVSNGDKTAILHDGDEISYNQPIYLIIDTLAIENNYKFAGWQYKIVESNQTPDTSTNKWVNIESLRYDSIDFRIPDANDGQSVYFKANFTKVTYTVSYGEFDKDAGSVALQLEDSTPTTDKVYAFDENVYVKISAKQGYYLNSVLINGVEYKVSSTGSLTGLNNVWWDNSNSRLIFQGLTGDVSVGAIFKESEYGVLVNVTSSNIPSNSTDVVDKSEVSVLNKTNKVLFNHYFVFKVNVQEGYEIDSVLANTKALTVGQDGYYSAFITETTTINVVVKKISYSVTAHFAYDKSYDYSVDESCIHGLGEYFYDSTFTITVDLPEMFKVTSWKVNTTTENNTTNTTSRQNIRENFDITIYLSIKTATINFGQIGDSASGNWYTIYVNNTSTEYKTNLEPKQVNYGDIVKFKVSEQYYTADGRSTKYVFAYWQVNGKSVSINREFALTVNADTTTVEAVYKPAQVKITANCYEFSNFTSKTTLSQESGNISGLNDATVNYGTTLNLMANANPGYKFVRWEDAQGNLLIGGGVQGNIYVLKVLEEKDIRAVFVPVKSVYVIADDEQGTISGAGEKVVGDTVKLTATAKKGYKFVSWNLDGVSKATTTDFEFVMPGNDIKLTAEFERIYTVNYYTSDSSLGQVVGNTSGSFKESITLEAISANNCSFVGWMVDNVMISTSEKLNISLNGDIRVQALFKKNFDWNIIIVLLGCAIFALVMVYGAIAYIKSKEAQPIYTRALIGSKDDSDIIRKSSKHNALRDEIAPVPTRKIQRVNVQPVPVRKIAVAPTDHKGNKVKPAEKAKDKKATLKTEE